MSKAQLRECVTPLLYRMWANQEDEPVASVNRIPNASIEFGSSFSACSIEEDLMPLCDKREIDPLGY